MRSDFSIEKKIMSGWGGGAFEIFTDNGEILNVGEVLVKSSGRLLTATCKLYQALTCYILIVYF